MRNRRGHVILSGAKNRWPPARLEGNLQILRSAQNDRAEQVCHGMALKRHQLDAVLLLIFRSTLTCGLINPRYFPFGRVLLA